VAGTEYISRDEPADRLIIGDGGVSLVTRDSTATVRYADCAILRTWPDGARQLVGYDGFIVHIEPTLYADVAAPAIRRIDGRVPDGERVALPPRDPAQIPRPKSAQGQPGRSIVARLAHLLRRTPS
jgi:zinc protease